MTIFCWKSDFSSFFYICKTLPQIFKTFPATSGPNKDTYLPLDSGEVDLTINWKLAIFFEGRSNLTPGTPKKCLEGWSFKKNSMRGRVSLNFRWGLLHHYDPSRTLLGLSKYKTRIVITLYKFKQKVCMNYECI